MQKSGAIDPIVQRQHRFLSPDDTSDFAKRLAPVLSAGDVILLQGDLGAGKTHFARSLIQARMAELGDIEDVPSPTYTLVQTYEIGNVEIWHTDLYRLSGIDDLYELGLDEAFHTAICLVEWPDRLADEAPSNALTITLSMSEKPEERLAKFQFQTTRWAKILDKVLTCG